MKICLIRELVPSQLPMSSILFKEESYKIIGACFEVHKILGHGFKEVVYKDALEMEFNRLDIPFQREKPFMITYKSKFLNTILFPILLSMTISSLK